ncbi:hypothetical protein CRE_05755 [Caenorhabditis remanei]|uniref:SXP/RAL-2 family protein Ani s 5-like cation-binding domain-containing protein n=1 Tax=Caenorhabditis remanei TaxID=31234 RepID=E3LZX6_CAERE|nr:hypothetical protein CRE_05755 [Caenorhabditis remanei]
MPIKLFLYWLFILIIEIYIVGEESIDELVSAGVSENAAAGIVKFDKKLQEPFEMEKTDPEGAKELEQVLHKEFTEYIENLSEYDQEAYQQFIKDKHAQLSIN